MELASTANPITASDVSVGLYSTRYNVDTSNPVDEYQDSTRVSEYVDYSNIYTADVQSYFNPIPVTTHTAASSGFSHFRDAVTASSHEDNDEEDESVLQAEYQKHSATQAEYQKHSATHAYTIDEEQLSYEEWKIKHKEFKHGTHSLTQSLTHSLIHSFTHSLTYTLIHLHSLVHSLKKVREVHL